MGIFFDDQKPKVSKSEFKKLRSNLATRGFTKRELDYLEGLFIGDIEEGSKKEGGIQSEEIDKKVDWLKENPGIHTISPNQIEILERQLKERL